MPRAVYCLGLHVWDLNVMFSVGVLYPVVFAIIALNFTSFVQKGSKSVRSTQTT